MLTSGGTCGTGGEGMDEGEVPGSNCFIAGITGLTGSSAPKESVFYQILLFEKEAMKTRNCDDPPRRPATKLTSVRLSLILCLRRANTSFEPRSWTNLGQIGNSKFVHKCWKRVSKRNVGEGSCREVLEKVVVEKCRRRALDMLIVEKYWRRVLQRSVEEDCLEDWRRVLQISVGEG